MRVFLVGCLILLAVLFSGCTQPREFVCPDGRVVYDASLCQAAQNNNNDTTLGPRDQFPCPFECCEGGGGYFDKNCPTGYSCDIDLLRGVNYCKQNLEEVPVVSDECEGLSGMEKDQCYINQAVNVKKDETLCEKVSDPDIKARCYSWMATGLEKEALCEKVPIEKNDIICTSTLQVNCRDECFLYIASHTGKASLCERMSDGLAKDNCYWQVAVKNSDPSLCSKINLKSNANYSADFCYQVLANELKDITLCENVVDADAHDICLITRVRCEKITNVSICASFKTQKWKDSCQAEISSGNYLPC